MSSYGVTQPTQYLAPSLYKILQQFESPNLST